nr:eukaryotic translation initiation factor 3 subunit d [Quercus suber]
MGRDRERREQTHPSPALPPPLPPITSSMSSAPPPVLKFSKLSFFVLEPEDLLLCGALEFYDRSFDRITPKNERRLERVVTLSSAASPTRTKPSSLPLTPSFLLSCLRKELDLDSEDKDGWFEEGARCLFDVCGFVDMVGMVGYLWPWV